MTNTTRRLSAEERARDKANPHTSDVYRAALHALDLLEKEQEEINTAWMHDQQALLDTINALRAELAAAQATIAQQGAELVKLRQFHAELEDQGKYATTDWVIYARADERQKVLEEVAQIADKHWREYPSSLNGAGDLAEELRQLAAQPKENDNANPK